MTITDKPSVRDEVMDELTILVRRALENMTTEELHTLRFMADREGGFGGKMPTRPDSGIFF
jgi:hypothetical protein